MLWGQVSSCLWYVPPLYMLFASAFPYAPNVRSAGCNVQHLEWHLASWITTHSSAVGARKHTFTGAEEDCSWPSHHLPILRCSLFWLCDTAGRRWPPASSAKSQGQVLANDCERHSILAGCQHCQLHVGANAAACAVCRSHGPALELVSELAEQPKRANEAFVKWPPELNPRARPAPHARCCMCTFPAQSACERCCMRRSHPSNAFAVTLILELLIVAMPVEHAPYIRMSIYKLGCAPVQAMRLEML